MIAKTEIWVGSGFIVLSLVFHLNSYLCMFNQLGCGMIEGMVAVYSLILGMSLIIGGLGSMHGWKYGLLAHLPIVYGFVFFITVQ